MSRHGVGLRSAHFADWLHDAPPVGLVEAITENFAGRGGRPLAVLEAARRDNDVVLHGVSLSIGSKARRMSRADVADIVALAKRVDAAWISDHLAYTTVDGLSSHDLWPLPFTEECLRHVVERVSEVQELFGRRLVLENVSSYVRFEGDEMAEWEFLSQVAIGADCEILLDLTNVFINARNHGFDPQAFIAGLPGHRVRQIHLAGHDDFDTYCFDSHRGPVCETVWDLYRRFLEAHGPVPVVIEWDRDLPDLSRLVDESRRARSIEASFLEGRACRA